MEKLYLREIAAACKGEIIFGSDDVFVESVVIDSRKVTENSLFIGIAGERADGNSYVMSAFEKGASAAIIEKDVEMIPTDTKGLIRVEDSKKAMLALASWYKSKLGAKFIAVTGSTGKTSVKDMLHGMLSTRYKVFKTRGNYNNDIGLPLMLFSMDRSYDMAVLEMGMSDLGEIRLLADLVRPESALITNIGISHIENLKTQENILKAKMEVTEFFREDSNLFINADDEFLKTVTSDSYRVITAGVEGGFYKAENITLGRRECEFDVVRNGVKIGRAKLEAPGMHNVYNGILCIACALHYGITMEDIRHMFFDKTSQRLEETRYENITVINDTYNASPDSMKSGLSVLSMAEGRKVALLGDMKELGSHSDQSHRDIGKLAREKADLLIAVGDNYKMYGEGFGSQDFYGYPAYEDAVIAVPNLLEKGDTVLLKASRSMEFERFLNILERI